jgi:hypothetical protein
MRRRREQREVVGGIDRRAVDQHFEMQMRARRAAGRADIGDILARQHQLADMRSDPRCVTVACHEPVAVIDFRILRTHIIVNCSHSPRGL